MEINKKYPLVSVCTPTYNRRPFIPIMIQCFKNQTYPRDRMEWIIVDDGTDSIETLIKEYNIPQIKYYRVEEKMTLGEKRNYMHKKTKGTYIVYMDDDDYYPPERVSHAISKLQNNPFSMIAGCSKLYIYFNRTSQMVQFGPYGENHATAATFAFRKSLLYETQYDDLACLAEERTFLKDYTIRMVQLNPLKTILVFAHTHNSVNKYDLLKNPIASHIVSDLKVHDFIRKKEEIMIYDFFTNHMNGLLDSYSLGDPKKKKDVLQYLHVMKQERSNIQNVMHANIPKIKIMSKEGVQEIGLQEVANILDTQQKEIYILRRKLYYLEHENASLRNILG